jgi:hypothetical protein
LMIFRASLFFLSTPTFARQSEREVPVRFYSIHFPSSLC